MNWIILIVAGLCECGFTFCLGKAKVADGWEATAWYAGFVVVSALSMILLAKATKTIPIGTAYPVWTGIGAVGTVLLGIFFFKEPATFWRLFFIVTLIASVIGLKAVSSGV
ncbi:MAG: multidrug efflux SMR transporter [Bacteroidales bacterium]|jgi:quaternary ammonium compound-resistance protein SugE|nr:multidrug efflux SMR transporter [Bacteroidales bacterium]MBQ9174803.1 multidrug efflux SMR transporter [Bacteroidales bacterium]MBQ9712233.1 multidrug efflux SMR transporter [Bacteroidales bacterium]MBR1435464.1 multidrug efflux SMR transporter [Bacteroidales bacterium]MBR6415223.1 multidrug efflux SMR transporter [Bacteroidales bacterium]